MSATTHSVNGSPASTEDAPETSVTVTNDNREQDTTEVNGDQVTYTAHATTDSHVAGQWPAEADAHVRQLIQEAQEKRQVIEDSRANHRNFNRMLTLVGAMVISFVLTWVLNYAHGLPAWAHTLAPFSFAITIMMDSCFTIYALIRHY